MKRYRVVQFDLRIGPSDAKVQCSPARSMNMSVSCNGTGWFSQNPRIGESVVMVQGGPASSKDRSVSRYGTG